MKATHTLYLLFISLLCVAGFTACDDSGSDDMIWDLLLSNCISQYKMFKVMIC